MTSLFYDGNPGLDLVLKAGVGIRIPLERCKEIVRTVESVCGRNLPQIRRLSPVKGKERNPNWPISKKKGGPES
ncbi:MAG: hypothetical protein IJM41_03570 [Bacteroidales bacterium]|nr:hypothetical protein [Bacteroidales bacterium]